MRRALVEETLAPLLQKACKRAGRDVSRLAGGTIAGNTTMLHILADEDPTPLGIAPFTARFLEGRILQSGEIGLAPEMPLQLLPGLSAYIGADITAGVHATGMTLDDPPSLLVDMGTNGEVVLCANGRLVGCATAAGPAFEGAGLSSGTRAQDGAVSRAFRPQSLPLGNRNDRRQSTARRHLRFRLHRLPLAGAGLWFPARKWQIRPRALR